MKKLIASLTILILVFCSSTNLNAQQSYFLELKVIYPTISMSDGMIIPHLEGNYANPVEYYITNYVIDTTVTDTLMNLDEAFFDGISSGNVVYCIDTVTQDTLCITEFGSGQWDDFEFNCDILNGPISSTSCDGNLHGNLNFPIVVTGVEVYWDAQYPPTLTSFIGTFDSLDISNLLCPGFYTYFPLDDLSMSILTSTFYVEPLVANTPNFDVEVFTSASSPDSCTSIATTTVSFAVAPLQFIWDGIVGTDSQPDLCPGIHTLLVIDANSDSSSVIFAVADSNYWYVDTTTVFTIDDTIYFMAENCGLNFSIPVDSIFITSVNFYNDSMVTVGFEIWQAGVSTFVQDTAAYGPPSNGTYLVDMTQFCLTKSLGGDVIKFNGIIGAYLGVNESRIDTYRIYPNPASNTVNIEGVAIEKICIYNLLGEIVMISNDKTIDVSGFAKGMYQLSAFDVNGKYLGTRKFVVQ